MMKTEFFEKFNLIPIYLEMKCIRDEVYTSSLIIRNHRESKRLIHITKISWNWNLSKIYLIIIFFAQSQSGRHWLYGTSGSICVGNDEITPVVILLGKMDWHRPLHPCKPQYQPHCMNINISVQCIQSTLSVALLQWQLLQKLHKKLCVQQSVHNLEIIQESAPPLM